MSGFQIITDQVVQGSGDTTVVVQFPVSDGKGLLVGDKGGAAPTELMAAGPLRWVSPNAVDGPPLVWSLNTLTAVAEGKIDFAGGVQQLALAAEIEDCEIMFISFRRFTAQPSATLKGGIYAAPPVSGVSQAGAMILPDTTQFNTWGGGLRTLRLAPAFTEVRRLVGLWWVPSAANPSALEGEYSVWAMPAWQKTWA